MASGIRESPYEPGCYFVGDQQWRIPARYRLLKVLGSGSFSFVCLAHDSEADEKVHPAPAAALPTHGSRALRAWAWACMPHTCFTHGILGMGMPGPWGGLIGRGLPPGPLVLSRAPL